MYNAKRIQRIAKKYKTTEDKIKEYIEEYMTVPIIVEGKRYSSIHSYAIEESYLIEDYIKVRRTGYTIEKLVTHLNDGDDLRTLETTIAGYSETDSEKDYVAPESLVQLSYLKDETIFKHFWRQLTVEQQILECELIRKGVYTPPCEVRTIIKYNNIIYPTLRNLASSEKRRVGAIINSLQEGYLLDEAVKLASQITHKTQNFFVSENIRFTALEKNVDELHLRFYMRIGEQNILSAVKTLQEQREFLKEGVYLYENMQYLSLDVLAKKTEANKNKIVTAMGKGYPLDIAIWYAKNTKIRSTAALERYLNNNLIKRDKKVSE